MKDLDHEFRIIRVIKIVEAEVMQICVVLESEEFLVMHIEILE